MKQISSLIARVTLFSFLLLAVAPVIVPATSSAAFAANASDSLINSNILVEVLCNVIRIVTGNGGKAWLFCDEITVQ